MQEREKIHQYLTSLQRYLARLSEDDANEVVREIESHIYDALEAQSQQCKETHVDDILAGFGDPRGLAEEYVAHIIEGSPPPSGFRALQSVRQGVTHSMYFATAFFGYLFSAALILVALLKPFAPSSVGVWMGDSGESFVVGMLAEPPSGKEEILGWWLLPIFLLGGCGLAYLTYKILTVLKRKLPPTA